MDNTIIPNYKVKKLILRRLSDLVSLAEILNSVPSTHKVWLAIYFKSSATGFFFLLPQAPALMCINPHPNPSTHT